VPSGQDLTRSAVLAELGRSGPLSRSDLAGRLHMSSATMTAVTRQLIASGMVSELETTPSRGGRPAQLLGLVGTAARAIGVKVAADHLAIVDVRLDGEVMREATRYFDASRSDALVLLAEALAPFCADDTNRPPLLGIGVGVPGVVADPELGAVDAAVLQWSKKPVGDELRRQLGQPVIVENNVNAVAVAERLYGNRRELDSFMVVTIGSGIGFALVQDGVVYRGARGAAGEFGHIPAVTDGPLCQCGNRGCLEALIGEAALVKSARRTGALARNQEMDQLVFKAESGHAKARQVFAEAGEILARSIATMVNVLDPQAVLILGEGTAAWRFWEQSFHRTIEKHLTGALREVPFMVDQWEDSRWAQGAAALVLATPFDVRGNGGSEAERVLAKLTAEGG
jgi:predicted NBD/HSP70 family sugar kinase